MHPALVAAFVLGNLPVYLYPQPAMPDASWPTHATIAVPQGWVGPKQQMYLTENGRPMLAQVEVVSRWPDGSPKWLHTFGQFHYAGGQPAKYEFVRADAMPADMPASPLRVKDEGGGLRIENGELVVVIPRPFVGITLLKRGDKTVVRGDGGPYVVDGEGTLWHSRHDPDATVSIEQQGPAQVTIKATGFYQTSKPRQDAFCRFTTRFTIVAGSPIIKVDHATTFADDMKKHLIAELGFKFALPGATGFNSATHRGRFHEKLRAAYLAQLTDDRLYRIAQTGSNAESDIRHQGDFERSVGWFSTTVGDQRLALLARDFWQKYPKEVKFSPDELVFYQWPRHGELSTPDPDATALHNVYKFKCFHSGDKLDSHLPQEYFQALANQGDSTECKAEFARDGNLQGASMRNQFALVVLPDGEVAQTDAQLSKLHELYLLNPTARISPRALAESGALGRVAPANEQLADTEQVVVDGILGYARAIPRYNEYGWGIYGNVHNLEQLNYVVNGRRVGRPSLHRVWQNSHYQHITAAWGAWGLNGDQRLLELARVFTDNYASIGQIRYDKVIDEADPEHPAPRPGIRYHSPGGFYHCKAFLPWGSRSYETEATDDDASLWGHWPDPSALLWAWLYDADRWAKDGYDLWRERLHIKPVGIRREFNSAFVQVVNAYEYEPTEQRLQLIKDLLFGREEPGRPFRGGLISQPLVVQNPGPLFSPNWLSKAYDLFPENKDLRDFIIRSADAAGVSINGTWTLSLSATAWKITGDPKYLLRHAGSMALVRQMLIHDPSGRWEDYGLGAGPTGDDWFALQWHDFVWAWQAAGLGAPEVPSEPGTYWNSQSAHDSPRDVAGRGAKILILQESDKQSDPLDVQTAVVKRGALDATSFSLVRDDGQPEWSQPKLVLGPRVTRPSSLWADVKKYQGPQKPGMYMLLIGSETAGVFQGLAGGRPECQLLASRGTGGKDPVTYCVSSTRGWLAPNSAQGCNLRIIAGVTFTASWVAITPRGGTQTKRWLIPGDTVDSFLDPATGPWLFEVGGPPASHLSLTIESQSPNPLLYGANLEHIKLIQEKLKP